MNKEKYKTILHYIIQECGSKSSFGRTVLWKLPYFVDFDFYELFEEKLTGEEYKKIDYGPAPKHVKEMIRELKSEGKIDEIREKKAGSYDKWRYIALTEPNLKVLLGNEKEVIDNVIKRYGSYNATQIEDASHQDIPVRATKPKEWINYELVFYREAPFSVRSYEEVK